MVEILFFFNSSSTGSDTCGTGGPIMSCGPNSAFLLCSNGCDGTCYGPANGGGCSDCWGTCFLSPASCYGGCRASCTGECYSSGCKGLFKPNIDYI